MFSVRASLEQFTLPHPGGKGDLKISVAAPTMLPAEGPVPVFYVMDGDFLFGMASEVARAMQHAEKMPPAYVVGIGYDVDFETFSRLRMADLAPPTKVEDFSALGKLGQLYSDKASGGADGFLAFLVDQLVPEINSRYPQTQDAARFLFGHSLGGLFTVHALLTRPDSFSAFLASSPSLWWAGFVTMKRLPAFRERLATLQQRPDVFIDVGEREQENPTQVPAGMNLKLKDYQDHIRMVRMVDAAKELADALVAAGIPRLRHTCFASEDHVSVAPTAMLHAMRFALRHRGDLHDD